MLGLWENVCEKTYAYETATKAKVAMRWYKRNEPVLDHSLIDFLTRISHLYSLGNSYSFNLHVPIWLCGLWKKLQLYMHACMYTCVCGHVCAWASACVCAHTAIGGTSCTPLSSVLKCWPIPTLWRPCDTICEFVSSKAMSCRKSNALQDTSCPLVHVFLLSPLCWCACS